MITNGAASNNSPPRSIYHKDKEVKKEGNIILHGKRYFQRIFADGSTELVQYNARGGKWVIQCFQGDNG
jgi:hypothetical protein